MLLTPSNFHRAGGFASWMHLCCCQNTCTRTTLDIGLNNGGLWIADYSTTAKQGKIDASTLVTTTAWAEDVFGHGIEKGIRVGYGGTDAYYLTQSPATTTFGNIVAVDTSSALARWGKFGTGVGYFTTGGKPSSAGVAVGGNDYRLLSTRRSALYALDSSTGAEIDVHLLNALGGSLHCGDVETDGYWHYFSTVWPASGGASTGLILLCRVWFDVGTQSFTQAVGGAWGGTLGDPAGRYANDLGGPGGGGEAIYRLRLASTSTLYATCSAVTGATILKIATSDGSLRASANPGYSVIAGNTSGCVPLAVSGSAVYAGGSLNTSGNTYEVVWSYSTDLSTQNWALELNKVTGKNNPACLGLELSGGYLYAVVQCPTQEGYVTILKIDPSDGSIVAQA